MRVLLDTNIVIHREAAYVKRDDIGDLFHWLDRMHADKCIHPRTIQELQKHQDERVSESLMRKLKSYHELKTLASDSDAITALRANDRTENDAIDTDLIREVLAERVDYLISEDHGIHNKAAQLGIAERVFRIDTFLELAVRQNPELTDYTVLDVRKAYFGNINLSDPFFDSFRDDYPGFDTWFQRKADEVAYICQADEGRLLAFLYLKREDTREPYSDISPTFRPAQRLKIGTFKVVLNGYKLGERFLKIVFDNALSMQVDEIYVTIFRKSPDQERLIDIFCEWGFQHYGKKTSNAGEEEVWVRDFRPSANRSVPSSCYPYIDGHAKKYIVPIYPEYHTELLPDSILRTESPMAFVENRPNRNAIRKGYISRSIFQDLNPGDIIVFYRTGTGGPAHYTAVATTIGVVESIVKGCKTFDEFRSACGRITVFSDEKLLEHWDYKPRYRPFVVKFLYIYSFPKRPNLATLKDERLITEAPRGFEPITDDAFKRLLEISDAQDRFVIY